MPRGLAVVLGVSIALLPHAASAGEENLVGAEACATCHPAQYKQWRASGHANALSRLSEVQRRDRGCRSCHTMAPLSDDPALSGIQYESCHGEGRYYSPRHVMKDSALAKLLGLKPVTSATCDLCHRDDGASALPFHFENRVELVRHRPKPPPEAPGGAKPTP